MKKYIMFPHGGSGNHGCEAIVRTTADLLKNKDLILFSDRPEEDIKYGLDKLVTIKQPTHAISKNSSIYWRAVLQNRIMRKKDAFDMAHFHPIISEIDKDTVLLSIGGDNYCYGDNDFIYMVNKCARKSGAKTVLWGCSVDVEDMTDKMRSDLKDYDLIVARESLTYNAIKTVNSHVELLTDPAFLLKPEKCSLPEVFSLHNGGVIGINVSPLITLYERQGDIVFLNYLALVKHILNETNYSIALIPHVVWEFNDDRTMLKRLFDEVGATERVGIVEDASAPRLKYVISQCAVFVGARTHSTIAAYSSCVPTLVLGYSVKSRGIAKDLFGDYSDFVLDVKNLENENDLLTAFMRIEESSAQIRKHMCNTIPKYIDKAYRLENVLEEVEN